jgi:hypothetical protein
VKEDSLELKKKIAALSDDELVDMVTASAGDYREPALNLAKAELTARGINYAVEAEEGSAEQIEADSEEPLLDSHGEMQRCIVCGGLLRYGTLVGEKEVTIIFSDNDEERVVRVSACSRCGQISMRVGYEIDAK